jgi:hypothetical protein
MKPGGRRALGFLALGIGGGTLLVALLSYLFHNWSYLVSWISGVVVIAAFIGYKLGKMWLFRRAVDFVATAPQVDSEPEQPTPDTPISSVPER